MSWKKTPRVAQYDGADWSGFIRKQSNCSVEQARRIAICDPRVHFFFFCREYMFLAEHGAFEPGDAVFFSGEPWFGSAPQCDAYVRDGMTVAYVNSAEIMKSAGDYYLADGSAALDVVCIFAANLNVSVPGGAQRLAPNTPVPSGSALLVGNNPIVTEMFPLIEELQEKGIAVLLTVLGNHDAAGWSNFSDETSADNFAAQLQETVQQYKLDGIDIDDEYSNPDKQLPASLIMVTSCMQKRMSGKIISKALFSDLQYFPPNSWNSITLADTLTYGWEMSYGGSPAMRLPPYANTGMAKNTLSLGFWDGQPSMNPATDVDWLRDNGYGGVMVYAFGESGNTALMCTLVNAWYGPGNWNYKP